MAGVGIVADQVAHAVGAGADHGQRFDPFGERQQVAVVLEQHNRLLCNLACQAPLLRRVEDLDGAPVVHIRLLEQAQHELHAQVARYALVNQGTVDLPTFDRLAQGRAVAVRAGQLHIQPGGEGLDCRRLLAGDDLVKDRQLVDRKVVGDNDAVEAPAVAQQLREQVVRAAAGHAIQFVIGVHD